RNIKRGSWQIYRKNYWTFTAAAQVRLFTPRTVSLQLQFPLKNLLCGVFHTKNISNSVKRLLSGIQATLKRLWSNAHQWNASRLVSTLQQVLKRCSEQSLTMRIYQCFLLSNVLRKSYMLWSDSSAEIDIISMSWNVKKSHD